MTRRTKVEKLRAQLAALIAAPGPAGQRGRQMWPIAEEIAAATGETVKQAFARGVRDVVARQMREAFP